LTPSNFADTKRNTMEKKKNLFRNVLDSEMFGDENKQYYFDIKKGKNEALFLQITNRNLAANDEYKRTHIILFEDDLAFFVEALTMLLGRHATGNLGASC
jgi:DNA repair protein RadC